MASNPLQDLIDRRLANGSGALPDDEETKLLMPILWSFLTRKDVNEELAKEPASIRVSIAGPAYVVQLSDPTLEYSLTCVSNTLAACFQRLEETAAHPLAPWVPWRGSEGKFTKRSKRSSGQAKDK